MTPEEMKAITRRFAVEPWSTGNVAVFDELCAPSYRLGKDATLQDLKDGVTEMRKRIPDLQLTVGEMIAEGDMIAYRWTMHGTHGSEHNGIAPTGKPVTITGITILRFADGKIVADQFESGSPSLEEQIS